MEKKESIYNSPITCAQYFAVPLAVMWVASFACSMYSANAPLLGLLGNVVGAYSLFVLTRYVALFRHFTNRRSWVRTLAMASMTCLLCTLLTTFAQYLYFRFLDGGRLLSSIIQTMEAPGFEEAWQQMATGLTLEQMKEMMTNITLSDITQGVLSFNIFLSFLFSTIATLISPLWRIKVNTQNTSDI